MLVKLEARYAEFLWGNGLCGKPNSDLSAQALGERQARDPLTQGSMTMKLRHFLTWFLLISLVVILAINSFVVPREAERRREAVKLKDNLAAAQRCIEVHDFDIVKGITSACDLVNADLLPEEVKPLFAAALEKNTARKAAEEARKAPISR